MLQLSSLTKGFGGRILFDRVTWQISAGDRVGLCGPNGSGKTTLLRMLAGFDEADSGTMAKRTGLTVGYLPQDGLSHTGRSLIDEVSTAFQPLLDIQRTMQDLEHRLADPGYSREDHDAILEQYSELQHRFRDEDGYAIDLKVAGVLNGLGFAPADFEKPTDTSSAGRTCCCSTSPRTISTSMPATGSRTISPTIRTPSCSCPTTATSSTGW